MACEDYDLAYSIGEAIKAFDKNLIYMCNANTQMDKAGDALGLKVAKEYLPTEIIMMMERSFHES